MSSLGSVCGALGNFSLGLGREAYLGKGVVVCVVISLARVQAVAASGDEMGVEP